MEQQTLTPQETARVLYQYIGKRGIISHYDDPAGFETVITAEAINTHAGADESMLQAYMVPLDKISKDDAIATAKIILGYNNIEPNIDVQRVVTEEGITKVWFKLTAVIIYNDCFVSTDNGNKTSMMCYEAYEYLKSKGYAVPLWFDFDHWANGKTALELNIGIIEVKQRELAEGEMLQDASEDVFASLGNILKPGI